MPPHNNVKYSRPECDISSMAPHWADAQMVRLIGIGKRVLEIGCASGHFGKYLTQKAGCKVWGVDIDERLVHQAQPYYEKIYTGDIQDKKVFDLLETMKFDVILCSNILEHLTAFLPVLSRLKDFLEKEGYFVIALPNITHWSIRLKLLMGDFEYTETGILDSTHVRFFTWKTAMEFLKNAGLKIENFSFDWDNGIPKFNGLVSRIPKLGESLLKRFYSFSPELFGYQFIFKASPAMKQGHAA